MYSISEQLHPISITLSLSPFTLVTTCLFSSLSPHLTCIYYHCYCITIISHITSFIVSHFISLVFKSVLHIHFITLADNGCNTATTSFQTSSLQCLSQLLFFPGPLAFYKKAVERVNSEKNILNSSVEGVE